MKVASTRFKTDKVTADYIESTLLKTNPRAFIQVASDGMMTIMNLESTDVIVEDNTTVHITKFFEQFLDCLDHEGNELEITVGQVTYRIVCNQ